MCLKKKRPEHKYYGNFVMKSQILRYFRYESPNINFHLSCGLFILMYLWRNWAQDNKMFWVIYKKYRQKRLVETSKMVWRKNGPSTNITVFS